MSWNKHFIIVKDVEGAKIEDIVNLIGYSKLELANKTDFRTASHISNQDEISFGIINGDLWIISPIQVNKFFQEEPAQLELGLCEMFSETTILAIEENGTVGGFGFNLIKSGARQRVFSGSDGEYYFSFGKPLSIEKEEYLNFKENLDTDEKEEIREDEGEEGLEHYIKFESLWGVPLSVLISEIGLSLDDVYDENPEFYTYLVEK